MDRDININLLKRLVEGLPVSVSRKHKSNVTFSCKHPIIFNSNYDIGGDDAFKSKFVVLHATVEVFSYYRKLL